MTNDQLHAPQPVTLARASTTAAPLRRRPDLRRIADYLHLGKTALVLLSAALGFFAHQAPELWDSPVQPPPPSVAITSPADTAEPHQFTLAGTYAALPPGALVWAVTQDDGTLRYYPQDRPCAVAAGRFNCGTYYLGPAGPGTGGGAFTLKIVAASAAAATTFTQYQIDKGGPTAANDPGLAALPDGAVVLTEKQVVRT